MSESRLGAGTLIGGRYLLTRHLGEGGMGTVWEATHTVTERSVAMKFLKDSARDGEALRKRFLREASIVSSLRHPNVVEIIDVFEFDELAPVLVMELLRGETLGSKLQREERLSLEQTAALMVPVVSAVDAAHALGIVHRDLKPDNIFLSDSGQDTCVKVLDFGIAKVAAGLRLDLDVSALHTGAGVLLGTPGYMAPEQATGEGVVDQRADVWAVGLILYECLSGSRPIDGDSYAQVLTRLLSAGIVPLDRLVPDLPREIAATVMQMLSRDPARRPQSVSDVGKLLRFHASRGAPNPRGLTELSAPPPSSQAALGELFGRASELSQLNAALAQAEAGNGSLVVLTGEAGIGKSRLAKELAAIAHARGITVAWGRAWEAGGAPPFWPWTQVFRVLGVDTVASLEQGAHSEQRFAFFDLATRALADAAAKRPLLLLLDDLHVADASSLLLLLFAARELAGMRVLIVGTARESHAFAEPELGALLAKVRREAQALLLRRLTREAVSAWTSARSAQSGDHVFEMSEGNPLFVEELLRVGATSSNTRGALAQVIDEHLARLSDRARALLEAASVLGREFAPNRLSTAFGFHPDQVALDTSEAAASGVLVAGEHEACAFSHALLRDRLYEALPPSRRAQLHWKAGVSYQASGPIAAHHLLAGSAAGDAEAAAAVARDAARAALAQLGYEEAASLAKRAQAVVPAQSMLGCELELVCGEALIRAGKGEEGRAAAKRAALLASELDLPELVAKAALAYGTDTLLGRVSDTMVELLTAALERLPTEPSALRVRVMARLAAALSPPRDDVGAQRIVEFAHASIAMARELGDKSTLLYAFDFAASSVGTILGSAERASLIAEAVSLARELDQRLVLERLSGLHICLLIEQGRRAEANVELRAFEELILQLPSVHRWRLLSVQSVLALLDGRFDDALRLSDESRVLGRSGSPAEVIWGLHRMAIAQASGEPASIIRDASELLRIGSAMRQAHPAAWLLAAVGRAEEARAVFETSLGGEQGFWGLIWAALACAQLRDVELAGRVYPELLRARDNRVLWGPGGGAVFGPTSRVLGDLALLLGRRDEARAHYEDAISLCRSMNAKPLLELSLRARAACGTPIREPAAAPQQRPLSLRREGDIWAIESGNSAVRLKHSKGLAYLEQLVLHAGRELHVLVLVGAEHGAGDAGAMLDARAKAEYQRRIAVLDEQIELARSLGDQQRVALARAELDVVAEQLAAAVGLGGRDRRAASNVGRARINVQRRLKDTIEGIAATDAALGRYLQATIKTGTFCSFQPM